MEVTIIPGECINVNDNLIGYPTMEAKLFYLLDLY